MAKRFLGTTYDGTPIMRDVEADIAEVKRLLASMNNQERARWLKEQGAFDVLIMLNNGEASVLAPYPDCYHPYDSDGFPDLGTLVDIDGNPVPFPQKTEATGKA